jgi:DNA-binding protein
MANELEESNEGEMKRSDDNSIFIGGKPFMNYVTAVVMQFTTKNADEVIIKARGKFISRAVDVAEVSAKRFLQESVVIKGININSEEFKNQEGRQVRVSTIEITLGRK